ncbi:putrescine transport system permease protein [Octadecabacter temperatus]|uniref:Putrescine transport system permease protein PotH n=1 Tax=Octadecabacter temperatus TaxID=1458307 RepID=A0A0K0Y562_9RHOB|nr:ABC transporter permease subunit [Octadecabacter temperatus]AKS46006.1 Putrescine transport system permease protein PotH [Octadecabacter temperatus]SIO05500.1 putrescine transport system permease protein [Octadecabacter temperatus]
MKFRRLLLISIPYTWLLIFFLVPFGIVLKISVSDPAVAIPPYTPTLKDGFWQMLSGLDLENYAFIGAGAVFALFVGIVLSIAMFQIVYPWVLRALIPEDKHGIFYSAVAALATLAVALVNVALIAALLSFLFPVLKAFVDIPDFLYFAAYLSSLKIAIISTFLTLLIGYPIAYAMARAAEHWRPTLLMLVILPFWTSFLIRVYAWIGILSTEGYLNQFLLGVGIIGEPLAILNTPVAVYIGIVYTYLPFMVLPIYAALEKMDDSLVEAAEDLGCSALSAFWLVTAPLSKPGVIAGCFLVFIPTLGEFVIPSLLGGSNTVMIGKVLWEEFFNNRDWPVASAVAVILLLILIIPIVLFQRNQEEAEQ